MTAQVFEDVHIGRGIWPLAQRGLVAIENGRLALFGSDRRLIARAPLSRVRARPAPFTGGRTRRVRVNGTRFTVSPGWGDRAGRLLRPGDPDRVARDSGALLRAIRRQGGTVG